ncbi:MAG: anti-phage deoxyguanosine triphosphatase [Pseudomonadota bacterium]
MRTKPVEEARVWETRRSGTDLPRVKSGFRDAFSRDRARIIHSAAFRRLQAKTQVLGIGEGDFHRTRLTHSMEVAQISQGIVRSLRVTEGPWVEWLPAQDLIEAIALAHDLGHPPFGHAGEAALNYAMRGHGGFEANGQTLRLISRLEAHTDGHGLDLTRRCVLGLIKYPVCFDSIVRRSLPEPALQQIKLRSDDWTPPKCYLSSEEELFRWVVEPFTARDRRQFAALRAEPTDAAHGRSRYDALDAGIMTIADDIAYGVHDFEDAVALRLVQRSDWDALTQNLDYAWAAGVGVSSPGDIGDDLFSGSGHSRKRAIGALVNAFVVSVEIEELAEFDHPLLRFHSRLPAAAFDFLDKFHKLVALKVINTSPVQTLAYRGQQIVLHLFEALASDPARLLTENFARAHALTTREGEANRVICDYIAGMTDGYATRLYERLFVPRHGQFSDHL